MAHTVHAILCAPRSLALAESENRFAQLEYERGNQRRAGEHAQHALAYAMVTLNEATPCGGTDRDRDNIRDIVDDCPDEPEDYDGDRDQDGCRDLETFADEDGDGITNVNDRCVDIPEDFDGHNDEDGCPETTEDSDGDGLLDGADQCPWAQEDFDNFEDEDGCPDPDNDFDDIPDVRDKCPTEKEDDDGWEDDDGCPEPDNDEDGILDLDDRCPDRQESFNEYLDEDGCMDNPPLNLKVIDNRILTDEPIRFGTGTADILPASDHFIDQIVQVLNDSPGMRIRIEGHMDSEGDDNDNETLSLRRARAIESRLIEQDIRSPRLETQGLGETQPIDTNRTPQGRAKNRRIEIHILQM